MRNDLKWGDNCPQCNAILVKEKIVKFDRYEIPEVGKMLICANGHFISIMPDFTVYKFKKIKKSL